MIRHINNIFIDNFKKINKLPYIYTKIKHQSWLRMKDCGQFWTWVTGDHVMKRRWWGVKGKYFILNWLEFLHFIFLKLTLCAYTRRLSWVQSQSPMYLHSNYLEWPLRWHTYFRFYVCVSCFCVLPVDSWRGDWRLE